MKSKKTVSPTELKKKLDELTNKNKILEDNLVASNLTISNLNQENLITTETYLLTIKALLIRLGGEVNLDAVTMSAARSDGLMVYENYDKSGGKKMTLAKNIGENEQDEE